MASTIKDITNSAIRTPFSIQSILSGAESNSGTNDTSRSEESVQSSNIVIPADQLGQSQTVPNFTPPPLQSDFNQKLESIKEQALKIQSSLANKQEQSAGDSSTGQSVMTPQDGFRSQLESSFGEMLNRDIAGESQNIRDYYQTADKEKLARDLSNEATAIKRDYEARIREARKNPDGKLSGALQNELDEITYQGNLELSEKMFQYNIANGDFVQAEKLANQVISDLEKADSRRLNLLKTAWDFVQDDLTESEKLQIQQTFENQQLERKSELDLLKTQFEYELDSEQRQFENNIALQNLGLQRQNLAMKDAQLNAENAEEAKKAKARVDQQADSAEVVINTVDEAVTLSQKTGATGFIGGTTKLVPNTPAYNLDKTITTIRANLGFDRLQQMRENSPTGGALGQVAVQELENLQATVASLDVGQGAEQLQQNLFKVRKHYEGWLEASGYTIAPNGDVVFINDGNTQ